MRRAVVIGVTVAVLGTGAMLHGQAGRSAEVQLKAAQQKADVEGDLKGAIEAYKKIVTSAGGNRALAATALARMAECYEKLGDAQARAIYEQVVREYADQPEAVKLARARLETTATQSGGIVTRQVWTGPMATNLGRVSLDGRYIAFTDWSTGDLALHDLASGSDRRLTNKGSFADSPEYALFPVISRDGRQVAYGWLNADLRWELRVMPMSGDSGKPRVLFGGPDVQYADVTDWSPDDKWLAVRIVHVDRTVQIGLVSVTDGAVRVLKSINWRGGFPFLFSPDGKYLAYGVPAGDDVDQSDIHVIAADGSRESGVVLHPANDNVLGWSPDGSYVLFDSDRGGSNGLWAVPIAGGKSSGEPRLIKPSINSNPDGGMGVTRVGTLYYAVGGSDEDVYIASVNFETGTVLDVPKRVAQQYVGSNTAAKWSPDGKYLAYLSLRQRPTGFNPVVAVYSLQTGQTRELKPGLVTFTRPFWSPDSKFVIGTGSNRKGQDGIYRVDIQTGDATLLLTAEPGQRVGRTTGVTGLGWSADGNGLIVTRMDFKTKKQITVLHDLQTGLERSFGPNEPTGPTAVPPPISPDGKLRAFARVNPSTKSTSLQVVPTAGGESHELMSVSSPEGVRSVMWTPDGRYVVFVKTNGADASRNELWRVPREGGVARRIEINGFGDQSIRIHPDGHHVVFAMSIGASNTEVWRMENIVSALKANK